MNTPINKLGIVLVLIVLLPALIYTAYEFNSLNENEKLLSDIYKQQLNAILFSANQYTWDYVNNWVVEFEQFRLNSNKNIESEAILNDNAIDMIIETDSSFNEYSIFSQKSGLTIQLVKNKILDKLKNQKNLYKRLKNLKKQGYQKIEAIILKDFEKPQADKVVFLFIPDYAKNYKNLVCIVTKSPAIIKIIAQKLDDIASNQFKVGIFKNSDQNPIYSNEPFQLNQAKQTKNIWIFPDYFLGISLKGESIENIIRKRFYYSLGLIVLVDLLMLAGVWMIFRNMKREMELARLKTDFVANVSHELRTPLALIRMYAETLEMGRLKSIEKKQSYYQIIKQESERLTRIINNILNFSRIESGKKQYSFSSIDLNMIVKDVIDLYEFHLQNQGFNLHVNIDKSSLKIKADKEAVSEALINLLDNAIKYCNNDKKIFVTTGKENESVYVTIEDHGIGIKPENQKYIFDKFYRVSDGSTFSTKGSGLGLSLVKHIMDSHGGSIVVDSTPGKGSIFKLLFKITKE